MTDTFYIPEKSDDEVMLDNINKALASGSADEKIDVLLKTMQTLLERSVEMQKDRIAAMDMW